MLNVFILFFWVNLSLLQCVVFCAVLRLFSSPCILEDNLNFFCNYVKRTHRTFFTSNFNFQLWKLQFFNFHKHFDSDNIFSFCFGVE